MVCVDYVPPTVKNWPNLIKPVTKIFQVVMLKILYFTYTDLEILFHFIIFVLFDLLEVSFIRYWLLPKDFHNTDIITCLVWKCITCQIIWDHVNNIRNVEMIKIHVIETNFIPLLWQLQFILDYGRFHKVCIGEVKFTRSEVEMIRVLPRKYFWIPLQLQVNWCMVLLRGYMEIILLKP